MKYAALFLTLAGLVVMAGFAPPSGRPPIGPLERFEPRRYDLRFDVTLTTLQQLDARDRQNYDLKEAPIVFPIIFLDSFSKVESDSVKASLWLESRAEDPRLLLKSGFPFNTHLATLTIDSFNGQSLRWQVIYRVQVWSSRIDDEKAAQIAWPKEWPKEVQDGLQPQKYIESDDQVFAKEIEKISGNKLHLVPPYLAAKDIIRHCINEIQVSGDGTNRGEALTFGAPAGATTRTTAHNSIRGMNITGAINAATKKMGTPHDLVCVCIAMLRAAGIPARPIIGTIEDQKGIADFVSWGEFYLPEAGWVPFDPMAMRGKGIRSLDVRKAWPELGTMKDLNKRIPLSYYFIPPASVESPQFPAVWGWDPRPGRDPASNPAVFMDITSRGKGVEDPQ